MKIALIIVSVLAAAAITGMIIVVYQNKKLKEANKVLDPNGVVTKTVVDSINTSGSTAPKTVAATNADIIVETARKRVA